VAPDLHTVAKKFRHLFTHEECFWGYTTRGTKRTFKKAGLNHIRRGSLTRFGLAGYYPDWASWANSGFGLGWPSSPSVEAL